MLELIWETHEGHQMDWWLLFDAGIVSALVGFFQRIPFGGRNNRTAALAMFQLAASAPEGLREELIEGGFSNGPRYWALVGLHEMSLHAPENAVEARIVVACMQVWI